MYKDLSEDHSAVGALFSASVSATDNKRYRLTAEQVDFFNEFGYLKGIRILEGDQIETLRRELPALMDPANPAHELFY